MVDFNRPQKFTLNDFRRLLHKLRIGSLPDRTAPWLQGLAALEAMADPDTQAEIGRMSGIIDSMTPEERRRPESVIDESRLHRIAAGAGVEPEEVEEFVKQFQGIVDAIDRTARRRPPSASPDY